MNITARTQDILAALTKAKLTVSPNDTNPLLQNFAVRAEDGKLTVIATDLQLAMVCVVPASVDRPGTATLPGMKFLSIVENTSSDEVSVDVDDVKQTALVKTGNYAATLVTLPFDDYPRIEDFRPENAVTTDRASMMENLDRISFSVANNEAKRNLLAVYLNAGLMQATDGNVTTVVDFDGSFKDILIPALAVKDLVRVLHASEAKAVTLCSTESFLLFKLDADIFMTRLSTARFPDIPLKIIKPTEANKILLKADKGKLRAAVNRVGVTSSDKNLAICFDLTGANGHQSSLTLSSSDMVGNNSSEQLDVEYTGESARLYFNYSRILDILDALKSDTVEFKLSASRKMPVRVEEQNPKFMCFTMRLSEQVVANTLAPTAHASSTDGTPQQIPDEI